MKTYRISEEEIKGMPVLATGYKSPIEILDTEIRTKFDNGILKMVQNVGINVEKDELIKALRYDRDQYTRGYNKGFFDGYEKGQNETAKRIYEKAKKKKYVDNDDEGCYWGAIALDDLADICGVEVKE